MSLANTWQGFFCTSAFKVHSTQEDKDINNHHAEYPTLHLMTQAHVGVSNLSITLPAFAFLYVLPCKMCPTLCERLKQLGKVLAPLNCAAGKDLRKSTVCFRRLLMLLLLRGSKGRLQEMTICLAGARCAGIKLHWGKVLQWVLFTKHIAEKYGMMIICAEVIKKPNLFFASQSQGHAGRWAWTLASKSNYKSFLNQWEYSWKTKVGRKASFIFHIKPVLFFTVSYTPTALNQRWQIKSNGVGRDPAQH